MLKHERNIHVDQVLSLTLACFYGMVLNGTKIPFYGSLSGIVTLTTLGFMLVILMSSMYKLPGRTKRYPLLQHLLIWSLGSVSIAVSAVISLIPFDPLVPCIFGFVIGFSLNAKLIGTFKRHFVQTRSEQPPLATWRPHEIHLDGRVWVEVSPDEIKRQNQGLPPRNRR